MKDEKKTKKQLIDELIELRQKVAELVKQGSIESLQGIDERNQTKRLLRESEESFRALTETSQDVIMRFDFRCRHLYVNSAVERATGITAREFIGKTHKELGFPEHLCDLWESAIQKVFDTGKQNRIEFELPNKIWIDWLLVPELDQDGSVSYVITAARDITERKHMEQELKNYQKHLEELVNERTIDLKQEISIRKKTEESLRESQERFRALTENTSDWIWEVDQNGVYTYVSPKVKDLLGYEPNEIIGRTLLDLMPEDKPKRISEIFNSIVESRKSFASLENTNLHKDGRRVILETSGVPIFDQDSNFIGYRGIDRDITKRKQAEEELKISERILSSSFRSLDGLLVIIDKDFRVLMSNWKDHDFVSEEIRQGHPFCYEIFKHMEAPCEYCPPRDTFNDGKFRIYEDKNPVDGSYKEISVSPILDETGKVTMVIEHVRDITERKKSEEALQTSEAELHDNYFTQAAINMILSESLKNIPIEEFLQKTLNMILSIPWGGFETIGSISLVEGNADALTMKAQSNIPKPLKELCVRVPFGKCLCGKAAQAKKIQFAEHIDERHEICYEGVAPHGHYVVPLLFGGRTLGVLNIYLKEGHIRNQKEEEFLNTVADTLAGIIMRRHGEEEKEKLHAQLLQAQKMEAVGQLSGGIAHDFNNILTAIIGYGNLLKMQIEKDTTLSTYMKYILDSAERAANLTQDLLAFSRKQMISPKPINVNEGIKGAEKILLRLIGADIELSTHLSDKNLIVMADSTQMEHVLMNLATNARDAMPGGGHLLISSDFTEIDERFINIYGYGEKGKYAVITVSDTGVGIDEQTKDKIFEPFFTTKEVGKGTGLGLSMVYGIVKQHDGFINVYSEPGKGTTFKIYLPLIHAKNADTEEIELPISKRGIETILVAEDDALVRKFMREVLEDAGYTVIEAKDGKDAIKAFNENKERIKLLILDVIMPKKNGKEVYETLKELNPRIKALFISGYSADILHTQGIISEGPEVILKPVSSNKLLQKIRNLLDQ